MITGKKNLFIASLEIVAIGICLKIGYHLGNKLIERIDLSHSIKKNGHNKYREVFGGRKKVVEDVTGNNLSLL